jgi:hypothetical protein
LLELPFQPYGLPVGPALEGLWPEDAEAAASRTPEHIRNTASSMLGAGVTPTILPERYVVQAPQRNILAVSSPDTHDIRLAELPIVHEGVRHAAHAARITGLAWCDSHTLVSVTTSRCIARWRVGAAAAETARAPAKAFAPPQRVIPVQGKENAAANGADAATVSKDQLERLGVSPKARPDTPKTREVEATSLPGSHGSLGDTHTMPLGGTMSSGVDSGWADDPWEGLAPQAGLGAPVASTAPSAPDARAYVQPTECPKRGKVGWGGVEDTQEKALPDENGLNPATTWTSSLHDWTHPNEELPEESTSLDGFAGPPPRRLQLDARRRTRDFVSPKIGSKVSEGGGVGQDFERAFRQTHAFCQEITEKGKRSPGVAECLRSLPDVVGARSIASDHELKSKFRHTTNISGGNFEIEVKLPGGSLTLVRADLAAQHVVVDGLCDGGPERLIVRVPVGYDLGGCLRTVKRYGEGFFRLLVPRQSINKTSREGVVKL